jgi:hypothetical protein
LIIQPSLEERQEVRRGAFRKSRVQYLLAFGRYDLANERGLQSVLKQNNMAANKEETPTAPTFVYHATNDEVIHPEWQ